MASIGAILYQGESIDTLRKDRSWWRWFLAFFTGEIIREYFGWGTTTAPGSGCILAEACAGDSLPASSVAPAEDLDRRRNLADASAVAAAT